MNTQEIEQQLQNLHQQAQHFRQVSNSLDQKQMNVLESILSQINHLQSQINPYIFDKSLQDLEQYRCQLDYELQNSGNFLQKGKQLQLQVKTVFDNWEQEIDKINHDIQSIFNQQQIAKFQQISSQIKGLKSQFDSNYFQQILQQIQQYRLQLNSQNQHSISILQEGKSIQAQIQKNLNQLKGEITQTRHELQNTFNTIKNQERLIIQEPQKLRNILQQYRFNEQELFQKVNNNLQLSIQANNYADKIINTLQLASKAVSSFNSQEILQDLTNLSLNHSNFIESWQRTLNESPQLAVTFPQTITLDFIKTLKIFEDKLETTFDQESLELIREDDKIKKEASLEEMLKSISEDLLNLWKGALFALSSSQENPDYVRHCSVSLRELLINIIKFYAPDEDVFLWAEEKEIDYNKIVLENRPNEIIRRFKLVYIYRKYDHFITENNSFIDFVDANINLNITMINKLIRTFNDGTHSTTNQNTFNSVKQVIENIKYSIISILNAQTDNYSS